MDDTPVIDASALARLSEWGGQKLVTQMVKLYIENTHARLAQIDAGLAEGGVLREAEMAAHSLKSSAANVGARRVSEISAQTEDAAERGDTERVRELREHLGAAVAEAEELITAHLKEAED